MNTSEKCGLLAFMISLNYVVNNPHDWWWLILELGGMFLFIRSGENK